MRGVHDGAVWVGNADRSRRRAFVVDDGGGDSAKVSGAAGVGNGSEIRRYDGWGTYSSNRRETIITGIV